MNWRAGGDASASEQGASDPLSPCFYFPCPRIVLRRIESIPSREELRIGRQTKRFRARRGRHAHRFPPARGRDAARSLLFISFLIRGRGTSICSWRAPDGVGESAATWVDRRERRCAFGSGHDSSRPSLFFNVRRMCSSSRRGRNGRLGTRFGEHVHDKPIAFAERVGGNRLIPPRERDIGAGGGH